MVFSHKSHGQKSDKESQSPMLKIFRDMAKNKDKEKDSEKKNLLKNKADKKRKKSSRSKSKDTSEEQFVKRSERHAALVSNHELRNGEFELSTNQSTKSEKSVRSDRHAVPLVSSHELKNTEFEICTTHSNMYAGGKNDSWWFKGEQDNPDPPAPDESYSCISCALKKIMSTDYACVACLITLFTISVIVAFLLVYNSIPGATNKKDPEVHSLHTKNKIGGQKQLWWDHVGRRGSGQWVEDEMSSYAVPQSMDSEGPDFQDLSSLVDSDSELSKILDSDIINGIQNNDRLKEFYKKLIKTDVQIQNLKKNDFSLNNIGNIDEKYKPFQDRAKRSLDIFHKPLKLFNFKKNKKVKGHEKNTTETKAQNVKKNNSKPRNLKAFRNKRFGNVSVPAEIVIENKKYLIEYEPKYINRKSKCSHTPKETKSHEYQLKHPFYQNTQRLDEFLDKFLEKKLPEIFNDQFGLDLIFDKEKNKCKHPKIEVDPKKFAAKQNQPRRIFVTDDKALRTTTNEFKYSNDKGSKEKEDFMKINKIGSTVNDVSGSLNFGKFGESTTNNYGVLLSVSTMLFGDKEAMATSPPKPLMDRKPNIHKLLQADVVDKEAAGSKDLKDDTVLHTYDDEKERVTNVRKILQTGANDEMKDVLANENYRVTGIIVNKKGDIWNLLHKPTPEDYIKQNPSSILNPNWKGPMPLYPDELTSMITQGPISVNRLKTLEHSKTTSETGETLVDLVKNPIHSKDSPSETDEFEIDPTDMEDIVDYFPNNYERVVDMAQAYSDYGVLDGKKSETEKKVDDKVVLEGAGNRVKLSLKGLKKRLKNNIIWRSQNDEYPSNIPSEGFRFEIKPDPLQSNGNNVNMPLEVYNHLKQHVQIHPQPTSVAVYNTVPPFDKDYVTKILVPVSYLVPIQKNTKNGSKTIIFSVVNGKRSLKSVDLTEDSVEDGDDYANEDNNMTDNVGSVLNNIKLKSKRECSNNTYKINQDDAVSNSALMLAQKGVMSSENDKFEYELVNNTLGTTKNDDVTSSNKKLASEDELSNNTDINLSHLMMVLSNCFSTLDGVNIGMHTLGRTTSTPYHVTLKEINTNSTIETSSPKYDQGMIANVGHRSRLLLSIDVNVTNEIENKKDDNDLEGKKEMVNNNIDPKNTNITITNNIITPKATNINENKTKSIVKRNADDTNLIFSHDIYDDDYGVAMDDFDNSIRNKHSVELNNLLKKPNDWFHDKMRNIADRFQKKMDSFSKEPKNGEGVKAKKENRLKGIKSMKSQPKDAIYKRISRKAAEEKPELTRKTDFTALTAKMKKICRKAVKDIAQTKDLTGVKASKEEQVSSSLMRRLVGLMDDLVDYQVQQRTCHKLTPDLQNFLEWLTSPNTESESNKFSFEHTNDEYPEKSFSKIDDTTYPSLEMAPTLEREDKPDARSDCLGTLQAVQELMRQYDDMNDDEKSKMIDVKDYLESQMHYLQKLWSSNYEYGIYDTNSIRFKRDTSRQKRHEKHKNFNKKIKYGKLYGNKLSPHNNVKNTINYVKATNNNDNAVNNEYIHIENSSDEHNNNNDHSEQNNKSDEQNKNGHNEQNNNSDEQNNISQEQNNNGHYKQNNNSDEPNNNELTEQNNNSDEKNNYGHNKQNNNDDKEQNNKGNAETDSKSVKVKRNLRDVYYKAIADAKKITTVKNVFNEN